MMMMFNQNHYLNLGWFGRLWTISLLLMLLNFYSQRNSIECISLTTIVNPLSWYWSPTVGFRSAAATNDQANVAKYLQMIQSFFPKNNRTFPYIGSQPTTPTTTTTRANGTEIPTSTSTSTSTIPPPTTTMRWPSSTLSNTIADDDDGYGGLALTTATNTNNIPPFEDAVPRATSDQTIEQSNNLMAITSMATPNNAEAEARQAAQTTVGTVEGGNNMADNGFNGNLITTDSISAQNMDQADHKGLYGFNNNDILETTTTTDFAREQSRDGDEDIVMTTTTEPGSVQISSSSSPSSDLIQINPKINMSEFGTNQIQEGQQLEIIERSMMIPTTTTTTTTTTTANSASISPKDLNEIFERQRSLLEQSTNMIGDDVPATTVEPFPGDGRDNVVFDLSTIDTMTDAAEKHSTTTKMIPTMMVMMAAAAAEAGNKVWRESGTTKPKPVTEPEPEPEPELINVNEQADVEQRTMFNSKNNVDDDGGNSFIKKFHDAYYSNSNIFDELMKRYPMERAHRAMKHFEEEDDEDHIRTPQELTSNDLDAINQLFFGHPHPHQQPSRVHFDVENP